MRVSLGRVTLAALLLLALSGGVGAIDAGVLETDVSEPAAATSIDGTTVVWAGTTPELSVRVGAPVFDREDRDYRHYDVRVTADRVDRIGPSTTVLGETRVTLGELGKTTTTIELDPETVTSSDRTQTVGLSGTDRSVEVTTATVFVGVYPDGGSGLWTGETTDVLVIAKAGDLDGDGLQNSREVAGDTALLNPDTDGDDLEDGVEVTRFGTDPLSADTDGDGLEDAAEIRAGSDPTRSDTDGDGLSDVQEVTELPTDPARADTDGDGLTDAVEVNGDTDPIEADTDGDGLEDGLEVELGTDPTARDTDADGLPDAWEVERYDTDPTNPDTDGDGERDGEQVSLSPQTSSDGSGPEAQASTDEETPSGTGAAAKASLSTVTKPLTSGAYAPFAAIAVTLGLRRLFDWVTYP